MKAKNVISLIIVFLMLSILVFGCSNPPQKELPNITLLYSTGAYHKAIAESIQKMWHDQLGLEVTLESQEWSEFQESRIDGNYQIARHSLLAQYSNPLSFLDMWTSTNENNVTKWSNPKYDELIDKAKSTTNANERLSALHDAERILLNELPIIPVYYYTYSWLDNGKVKNYRYDYLSNNMLFTYATKEGESPIRYSLGLTPATLDPQKYKSTESAAVIKHCFEGLTTIDINGVIVPGIAESWSVSSDGLVWTFKLRDAKWSDGKPVTASDFVYAWQRAVNPRTGSSLSNQLWCLKNGEAITEGKIVDINQLGVCAIDNNTLQVTLEKPCGYLDQIVALPTFYPVRQEIVETNPDKWSLDLSTLVYNGPMKLTKLEDNNELHLVKNQTYWNKNKVTDKEVIMNLSGDVETSYASFKNGSIDIMKANSDDIFQDSTKNAYRVESLVGVYFFCINTKSSIESLNDPMFRKAMSLAIDRSQIAKLSQNEAITAIGFVPPGFIDSNGKDFQENSGNLLDVSSDYAADCRKAQNLLKDAGYIIPVDPK